MSMLLKSRDGKEFELALIADRLPEMQDGLGDDEIATVSFRVATEQEEWEETAPVLEVRGLKTLAMWLGSVATGEPSMAEVELLEPELTFKVLKENDREVQLRVSFHIDDRPEEFVLDADTTEARHIDLKLRRDSIRVAAEQLQSDIEALASSLKDDLDASEDFSGMSVPREDMGGLMAEPEARAETGEDDDAEDR